MRFLALLLVAYAAHSALAASCTPQCKEWKSSIFSVQGSYVPCSRSLTDVHIVAAANVYTQSGASTAECASSGSGTQLSISVPTGDVGTALFTWTYASANASDLCTRALRSDTTDSGVRLLGFSVTVQSGMMHSWEDGSLSTAACPIVSAEPVAPATAQCYSNQGAPAVVRGVSDTSATGRVEWQFKTPLDGTVSDVRVAFNQTQLATGGASITCAYNLGTSLLQVFDAVGGTWALSWQYTTYVSCDEMFQLLAAGNDDLPRVESIAVVIPGDQVYSWERDSTEGAATVRLSDYETACAGDQVTPTPAPSSAPLPPNVTLPVLPVVNCYTRRAGAPCRVHFGYYNPNNHMVALPANTAANQLVRQPLISLVNGSAVPSHFAPGWHNETVRVEFPCSPRHNNGAGASWKLRTPVLPEVAAKLDAAGSQCSPGCSHDVTYNVLECSGMFHGALSDDTGLNGQLAETELVMQCARAVYGAVPECV